MPEFATEIAGGWGGNPFATSHVETWVGAAEYELALLIDDQEGREDGILRLAGDVRSAADSGREEALYRQSLSGSSPTK